MTHSPIAAPMRQAHHTKGVWSDRIAGRFRKITVHQLAMAWWCHEAGHITRRQLRVWFAAHEMAERRRYTDPVHGPERPLYGLDEIKALVGGRGSERADEELSADLTRLARLGLVRVTNHAIDFAVSIDRLALDDVEGFWSMFNQLPHPRRAVPVPRRIVRALAAGFTRGMTAVVIATLIRSLFWHKEQGAFRVDGRTKREWIAEVFGIAPRTVTDARTRLIELGWLVPLETPQWLLNRYGTHDAINPEWDRREAESGGGVLEDRPTESASPNPVFPGQSATPDLNSSLPLTGNQKTRKPAPTRAGTAGASLRSALGNREKKTKPLRGNPNIRDVQPADLDDMERLLDLHRQAIEVGLAKGGEAGRLDFVALAERARSRGKRAGALFFWLLRERKAQFITLADEDEASRRIKQHLYGDPCRRGQWGGGDKERSRRAQRHADFSQEERFVVACIRVANQHRIDDPFAVARIKGWTRDRWDAALAAHHTAQFDRQMASVNGHSLDVLCTE